MASITRPRVFLDVSVGTEPIGRLVIELFIDKAPKTCENFRALCTGSNPPLTYEMSPFHRIIDEFMIQGGDIMNGDGTGGTSIYGEQFEDENIGWREIDAAGLVCMANRGRNTNGSQFFITLAPCTHLNAKHTVFGHLISSQTVLERLAALPTDKSDRPLTPVLISHSGEIERRTKAHLPSTSHTTSPAPRPPLISLPSESRGRRTRRRYPSHSPARSQSPSRGHTRRSASRHRHQHARKSHHHQRLRSSSSSSGSSLKQQNHQDRHPRLRRRSDASPDHTLRGRPRQRSRSRTRSPLPESISPAPRHRRQRSPPPSRSRRESVDGGSPRQRRQRSLPNQYYDGEGYARGRDGGGWGGRERDDEEALRREEWEREGGEGRFEGARGEEEEMYAENGGGAMDGVVYKGRGSMKYKERRRW